MWLLQRNSHLSIVHLLFLLTHLSRGLSPIMSQYGDEAADLAVHGGGLVINMGTLTSASITENLKAIKAYNSNGNPVVLDPVGAGATAIRRNAVKTLMAGGYFDLIKGNEREIREVYGNTDNITQRGVDSGPSTLNEVEKATLARNLARRERMSLISNAVVAGIFRCLLTQRSHR